MRSEWPVIPTSEGSNFRNFVVYQCLVIGLTSAEDNVGKLDTRQRGQMKIFSSTFDLDWPS